jgi:hypothetical protein
MMWGNSKSTDVIVYGDTLEDSTFSLVSTGTFISSFLIPAAILAKFLPRRKHVSDKVSKTEKENSSNNKNSKTEKKIQEGNEINKQDIIQFIQDNLLYLHKKFEIAERKFKELKKQKKIKLIEEQRIHSIFADGYRMLIVGIMWIVWISRKSSQKSDKIMYDIFLILLDPTAVTKQVATGKWLKLQKLVEKDLVLPSELDCNIFGKKFMEYANQFGVFSDIREAEQLLRKRVYANENMTKDDKPDEILGKEIDFLLDYRLRKYLAF